MGKMKTPIAIGSIERAIPITDDRFSSKALGKGLVQLTDDNAENT